MGRVFTAYAPVASQAARHVLLDTGAGNAVQTVTLEVDCVAVVLTAEAGDARVCFDEDPQAAGPCVLIKRDGMPYFLPVGHPVQLRMLGSLANTKLSVAQLA